MRDRTSDRSPPASEAALLFLQQYGYVRSLAVRCAPWPGLVDDIFQQVFLEFLQGAERYDLTHDLRPLLSTMTRRIAQKHWKQVVQSKPESLQRLAEHIRQIADDQPADGKWEAEFDLLRGCLQKLPEESQQLLNLYYFQGMPTEEIGQRLSMRADAVRRALSRLREKLRECVQLNSQPKNGSHV